MFWKSPTESCTESLWNSRNNRIFVSMFGSFHHFTSGNFSIRFLRQYIPLFTSITAFVVPIHWRIYGGRAQHMPPLRVQILSFRHKKFLKRNRLRSQRPPTRSTPPTGNTGSATAIVDFRQKKSPL